MWPFKRKDATPKVSSDVDDYYRSERRERVGLAWLLAFGSLIATLLIALVLFYGVRFVYHKVHHTNNGGTTATTESTSGGQESASSSASNSGQTNAPGNNSTSTPSSSGTSSSAANTGASSSATSSGQNLANTGPGSTVAIFFTVSVLGMLAHNFYQRRKFTD